MRARERHRADGPSAVTGGVAGPAPLGPILLVPFGLGLLLTGLVLAGARRAGALDLPDPSRRTHTVPTPRVGGVAVFVAAMPQVLGSRATAHALAATLFFLVGLLDDLWAWRRGRGLPARVKLALQVAAAAVPVAFLGLRFAGAPTGPWPALDLGVACAPMTVVWLLAVVTVVNFMDGIDGITAATCAVLLGAAAGAGSEHATGLFAATGAALVGFAAWNAPRARIFLGDGGSHFLGALVGCSACTGVGAGPDGAPFDALPWPLLGAALLPSIADVAGALVHKARHGIPLAQAHADHLYQRLTKAGAPVALVALRYGGLALLALVVVGPFASRVGIAGACAAGAIVLAAHGLEGRRKVRDVPRLARR